MLFFFHESRPVEREREREREMGTSVQVTPLCGVYSENPLSYLVSIDGFNFLVDCGWNDHFDPSLLEPLSRSVSPSSNHFHGTKNVIVVWWSNKSSPSEISRCPFNLRKYFSFNVFVLLALYILPMSFVLTLGQISEFLTSHKGSKFTRCYHIWVCSSSENDVNLI